MRAGDVTIDGVIVGSIDVDLVVPDELEGTEWWSPRHDGDIVPANFTTGEPYEEHRGSGEHHYRGRGSPGGRGRGGQGHPTDRDDDSYPGTNLDEAGNYTGERVHGQFAEARDRAREELKQKPWLNEHAMHIFAGENEDPDAATALWESAINRMATRGTTLEQEIRRHRSSGVDERGYYAGYREHVSPETRRILEEGRQRALDYSNVSNYATENASGDFARGEIRSGTFNYRQKYNGEYFLSPGSAEAQWRKNWNDLVKNSEDARKKYEHPDPLTTEGLLPPEPKS